MRQNCRCRLIVLIGFFASLILHAGHPSFRVFTTQDGLVRNWVTKIHRDSKGFLWFCTVEGISLFDGYQFKNFSARDGLPHRLVYDMIETRRGDYWFATEAGLAQFQPRHGSAPAFNSFRLGASKESNEIHAILEGRDGTIWCGTAAGLYRLRPGEKEIHPQSILLAGSRPVAVDFLAEDSRRNLWVAATKTIFRRRPNGDVDSRQIPPHMWILESMLVDQHDRLWLGGHDAVIGIDTRVELPRFLQPEKAPTTKSAVISLYAGEDGDLWIGKRNGLSRFHLDPSPSAVLEYSASDAFPVDLVGSIEEDVRHNLWLAVGSLGAVRIAAGSAELFTSADGLDSAEILGMAEGFRGNLFAITGKNSWTLNEFASGRFLPIPLIAPQREATWAVGSPIIQDREGAWWAASGGGVLRYSPAASARDLKGRRPERVYSVRDGLPSATVLRLFRDSRDDIWAGTTNGVGHWTRATGRWQTFQTAGLIPGSTGGVSSFAEDRSGDVWAGFYPGGLVRFRGSGAKLFSHEVPNGAVNALLSDHRGRLWIGSSQGGIGRMDDPGGDNPGIKNYSLEQGLSSEHVFSLAEDQQSRIYIADGRGVDRLDPETKIIHHFTASSVLPPGEVQSLFCDREGSIWFASFYGLARYRPEPDETTDTPSPLIRAVKVGGRPYPISELGEQVVAAIELRPGNNNLEIEFRSLHFDTRKSLRYQYLLEGADTDWSRPSEEQTVRYASLAPGPYRFVVRSITDSGEISSGQATLPFDILPAFWRRSWFLVLVTLAIVSGAVAMHRYRLAHLLALERVRSRLATDLHDDLGADLAEIAILSEVAKLQEHSRTVELLDGIAGRARSLREAMTDIVWTVDPREDSTAALVLRLRRVAFTMLENGDRSVEFVSPPEEQLAMKLAPAVRRHVLLFFKEVVTNVARHADATAVRLEIEAAKGHFRIAIRDNGCGFDPHQSFDGRGLRSLQYRAGELCGHFEVQSVLGVGTEITLRFLA